MELMLPIWSTNNAISSGRRPVTSRLGELPHMTGDGWEATERLLSDVSIPPSGTSAQHSVARRGT